MKTLEQVAEYFYTHLSHIFSAFLGFTGYLLSVVFSEVNFKQPTDIDIVETLFKDLNAIVLAVACTLAGLATRWLWSKMVDSEESKINKTKKRKS